MTDPQASGLNLREGRPEDDAACGRIIADATMASPLPARMPHAIAKWSDSSPLAAEGRIRVVAERSGAVAGFADYSAERCHLRYLFVAPSAQGHGIASALTTHIQEALMAPLSVHCLAVNDVALRWYLRHGFAVTDGFLEDLDGQDAVWLRLVRAYPWADQ